ncbi:MAG: META domain-containing protein [Flavobacteriales bacterium]|nr:META domain-containing protein [Flavobacteriales bacterium]
MSIFLASCGTKKIDESKNDITENSISSMKNSNSEVYGKYTIIELNGENLKEHDFEERTPMMAFNKENTSYSTNIGCNQISGKYEIDETTIKFLPGMATMMACPGNLEDRYLKALSEVNEYKIEDFKLKMYKDEKLLIVFLPLRR